MSYLESFLLSYAIVGVSAGLFAAFCRSYYERAPIHELSIVQISVRNGNATAFDRSSLFVKSLIGCVISPLHMALIVILMYVIRAVS